MCVGVGEGQHLHQRARSTARAQAGAHRLPRGSRQGETEKNPGDDYQLDLDPDPGQASWKKIDHDQKIPNI